MPSLRARLVNRYIRLAMKPKRLHEIEAPVLRQWIEKRRNPFVPKKIVRRAIHEGGVSGELVRPDGHAGGSVVLYLHGGGYVFGSPKLYRSLTSPLAIAAGAAVFAPDYRLAPEHPCPAAIDDAVAAYDWLLASGRQPSDIVVGGDSAGGGLALALLLALKARGGPMPAGAILYSPWTDLALTGASMRANADSDAMFQYDSIEGGRWKYLAALDPADPRASPLYADLAGLPPLLVFASSSEMLFDDASRLVEKAAKAGVSVRFEPRAGLVHVWPLFHPLLPEAKEAIALSAGFIERLRGA